MPRFLSLEGSRKILPSILIFGSGFAGLVYQVLWMRQLGLLFGNTAYATASVLAVFFAGLAVGSWFWGRLVARAPHPLRWYGLLEIGIAGGAVFFFAVMPIFRFIYPALYQAIGPHPLLFVVKLILAVLLIFPAAFFMGGTVPAMGQYLIVERRKLGTTAAWLYGVNTIGAASGVLLAAFVLVPNFGFSATCIGAMLLTGTVAALALWIAAGDKTKNTAATMQSTENDELLTTTSTQIPLGAKWLALGLAFLSGFSVLALEVVWTRLFAQIHENSVYSFSTVLVIVLSSLALAALIASLLARWRVAIWQVLGWLLTLSGITLLFFPYVFLALTNELTMLSTSRTFFGYFVNLLGIGLLTVGPVCLLAGIVFPFLMKTEEGHSRSAGYSIGRLTAVNTGGAILGSLSCGFLLLPKLGMWGTLQAFAIVYLIGGLLLPTGKRWGNMVSKLLSAAFLILAFTAFRPSDYPVLGTNPNWKWQTVVETWDTGDCSVAVVKNDDGVVGIKINSNYILGSTGAAMEQIYQGQLPLFIKPQTESVFFLGLGTGMTAGSILNKTQFPSIKRVVACELVGEVVEASEKYLTGHFNGVDYTFGLFDDPRIEIVIDDGRHYLLATDETFDMINADLFLPYRSGAGSLYSLEHFETVHDRLTDDGVYVQWLPLFQLTDFEFGVICHTLLSVFDHVSMWRNDFNPGREIVALVASKQPFSLNANSEIDTMLRQQALDGMGWQQLPELDLPINENTITLHYNGNLSKAKRKFSDYPLNTDDLPIIEYKSPISIRQKTSDGLPPTLIAPRFAELTDDLLTRCPPQTDPVLANRSPANQRLPLAGAALHRAWVGYVMGNEPMCKRSWNEFVGHWLDLR